MKYLLILCSVFLAQTVVAQDDLLSKIDSVDTNSKVVAAFKAVKIVNLESTKLLGKRELFLVIAPRFASVKEGFKGFFGLDNAITQIKFIYGITDKMSLGASRSEQAYDFSVKYLITPQQTNLFPFTIVGFHSIGFNNLLNETNYPKMDFANRLIYVNQLLISRKFCC